MELAEQYKAFWDACEDLKSSKIIIADAKVSKVLRSIVSCPALVEIVGEALVGYNFSNELSKAVSTNAEGKMKLILPSEPYRVIAFVFSLLSEFDGRRLDLQEFISQYFPENSLIESFKDFNEQLITPFRDYLCEWVGFKERKNEEEQVINMSTVEPEETQKEVVEEQDVDQFFEDITMILNQIKETVNLDSKIKPDRLDELNITINALLEVVKMQNFKIFNALLISLNNLLSSVKSVRFYNMELQNRLAKFYGVM